MTRSASRFTPRCSPTRRRRITRPTAAASRSLACPALGDRSLFQRCRSRTQTLHSLRRNAAPGFEFLLWTTAPPTPPPRSSPISGLDAGSPGDHLSRQHRTRRCAERRTRAAAGEYITFLDGDDFYAPGYLTDLVATIQRLGCEMVRTDHVRVHGRRRTVHRINHGPRGRRHAAAGRHPSGASPDLGRRAERLGGDLPPSLAEAGLLDFAEDLRTCEDRPWNWRLHLQADSFAVVGLLGVFYRRDVATSLTQLTDERQFDFLAAHDQIVALVSADPARIGCCPKRCGRTARSSATTSASPRGFPPRSPTSSGRGRRSPCAVCRTRCRTVLATRGWTGAGLS